MVATFADPKLGRQRLCLQCSSRLVGFVPCYIRSSKCGLLEFLQVHHYPLSIYNQTCFHCVYHFICVSPLHPFCPRLQSSAIRPRPLRLFPRPFLPEAPKHTCQVLPIMFYIFLPFLSAFTTSINLAPSILRRLPCLLHVVFVQSPSHPQLRPPLRFCVQFPVPHSQA